MFIPKAYEMKEKKTLVDFIKKNSFGILFSQHGEKPHGTHLPFIYESGVEGDYLLGHMARANPQWKEIYGDVLIVFSGPDAYISPAWYEEADHVPTWDYIAAHVYGEFLLVEGVDDLRHIMEKTIHQYESNMENPWDGIVSDEKYQRLIKGVVGFKIKINHIEGQWKLHQDYSSGIQKRVVNQLKNSNQNSAKEIAKLIEMNNSLLS